MIIPQNLVTSAVLLEDFENAAQWQTLVNATAAADTTFFSEGTQSVRMTCAGDGAWKMDKTTSWVTDGNLRLDLYCSAADGLTFYLGATSNYSKNMRASRTPVVGWNTFCFSPADWVVTGGQTWAETIIRMRIQVNSGQAGKYLCADNLRGNVVAQPVVLFTFDDGYDDIIDTAYPVFAARTRKATSFVFTDGIGGATTMTWDECRTLDAAGWDIGNHTTDHNSLAGLTEAQVVTEVTDAKAALDAQGLVRASSHVAYPNGLFDANTIAGMATAGMLTGRTIKEAGCALPMPNWYFAPTIDNLDSGLTLAAAQTHVATAIARQQVIVFYGHKIEAASGVNTWAVASLASLLDYITGLSVPVLTISQLYGLASGPLTYGSAGRVGAYGRRSTIALPGGVSIRAHSGVRL